MTTPDRERYSANRAFVLLATVFALLFGGVVALLAFDQHRVLEASQRLQQETVPEIIRFQRLARNLDQLRQEGERLFSAGTPEGRQQSLFIVMLVASHPSILEHPQSAETARDTENFLVETSRRAGADPALLKARHAEWLNYSKRLSLLVDDLSVQGASLATDDLANMVAVMRLARIKLLGALVLVGCFLLLMMLLLRQHLIRPLQRIDQALSSLGVDRPAPEFPDVRLTEIHAVEEATKRLHAEMVSNEEARRELELLASRDGLTGLMNRRHFMLLAQAELQRAHRYGRPIAVALGDLDFFKRLNDTYGHGAGDVVLRTFAGLLAESVRQSDLVCRYGGEEFAFLFPESSVEQARILVERFRQRFADHDIRLPDGLLVRVTLSIGLADASRCPIEVALQHADYALYEAKRLGRNRVIVADETT
ncbi:diguanylate cyclase [Dechloromonas sp. H13]|uniref:GGDEF domain-containing protein n=1 Tax=Dechloromonas sp. H13 TaxID=2570193 RepID=UPI0012919D35|nr:GGDEF domain-containing protein [Dechloromonas sp. H13]